MEHVLCIDADWDKATTLVRRFRDSKVYPLAQNAQLEKLQGKMARRQYVEVAAQNPEITFIMGSGHGETDSFMGDNNEKIWAIGDYDAVEVANRVVHLLSCSTASLLGPDMVNKGALAFIGYDAEFVFTDETADVFLECDAEIDRVLFSGGTVGEAHQAAKAAFNAAAENSGAQDAARLEFNRDHLMSPVDDKRFGSQDATI